MNLPNRVKTYTSHQYRRLKTRSEITRIRTVIKKKSSFNRLLKTTTAALLVLFFIATVQSSAINNNNLAYAQSEISRPIVTMNCSPVDDGSGAVHVNINIENLDVNSQYVYLFNRTSDASQVWTGALPDQVQQYTTTIKVPAPVPPNEQFLFQLERITDDGREFAAGKVMRCDQILPNSSIDSATDSAGNTIRNTSVTTADSITFEFSSPDSDVSGFECFLSTAGDNVAEDCTSPKTYSNLEEGEYQFTVIATDIAGNRDPTGPVFVWTIRSGNAASDLDRDGIRNEVDPDDNDPTNDSFETSSGTSGTLIRSVPNQNLTVTVNNEGGVTIRVFFGGPVHVEACDGQEIHDLAAGESIDVVCGSITVRVNEGSIELILRGDDGTPLTVNLQEGYEMTFEPEDNTITTPSSNPGPVTAIITETGNEITIPSGGSVQATYSIEGFYPPIDMNQVENIARAGQTIPFKFEVLFGTTEITDTDAVNFSQEAITCLNDASDGVEQTTTGNTRLVYDESSGQFVGHWKSPRTPGACYEVSASVVEAPSVEKTAIVKLR